MQSFPFDSQVSFDETTGDPIYDRAISSQPLRKLIRDLFTTGVMPNPSTNFQVSAGTDGMTIEVEAGFAVIDGGLVRETETRTLEVTAADNTYDRIDTVVLRWNENVDVRTADLYVVAGTPAASPVRPELQRDNSIYEIGLADVFITRNVATITDEKITDTRYESARCGVVSSVSEWDTTTIYQQVQADLASFKSNEEEDFDTWSNQQMTAFESWFETIQDILDENVAAHLQSEIDDIQNDVSDANTKADNALSNFAYVESGTVATKAYSVGEKVVVSGLYYKVIASISIGDTFVVDTNIERKTVEEDIADVETDISDLNKNVAWYGTSSATATSIVKVATTTDSSFSLDVGARVKIKFDNGNTSPNPTLNVNGTGAKAIYAHGSTTPFIWWSSGDIVEFTYDGDYWIMSPTSGQVRSAARCVAWYGDCSTAASTAAKTVSLSVGNMAFSLINGVRVKIKFTYGNTATNPTLNVNNSGAKSIYAYGTTKPKVWWKDGDIIELTYNGNAWIMSPTGGQMNETSKVTLNGSRVNVAMTLSGDVLTITTS